MLDSMTAVTGISRNLSGFPLGTRAIDFYPRSSGDTSGPKFGDQFFETFGRSSRNTICACETKMEPTLSQTLHLAVGDTLQRGLTQSSKWKQLIESSESPAAALDRLFILTLSRKPTRDERTKLLQMIGDKTTDVVIYQDILWSLINSTEFAFNH
jgi:hypothetical protein